MMNMKSILIGVCIFIVLPLLIFSVIYANTCPRSVDFEMDDPNDMMSEGYYTTDFFGCVNYIQFPSPSIQLEVSFDEKGEPVFSDERLENVTTFTDLGNGTMVIEIGFPDQKFCIGCD